MTETTAEQATQLGGSQYVRVVLLAGLLGIPAALVAALFIAFVRDLEHWLWTDLPNWLGKTEPPWYLIVGLPLVGASIVLIARRFLPGDGGHSPLEGISVAPTPVVNAPGIALAALGSLAFGAVLGPEMPVIALGSVVGMVFVRFFRLRGKESGLVATAGSFAAISALFGGPVVAGVMLTEAASGLGAAMIPSLLPGFVAAAVGYVVFVGFGRWGGLNAPGLTVPSLPAYDGTHLTDLLIAVAVGILTALLITLVRSLSFSVAANGPRRFGSTQLLLGGALAIGLITLVADALGTHYNEILFSGQAAVPILVAEGSTGILLLLIGAKALAYSVSLSVGFRGGAIFPAVFLGIGIASLAVVWFGMSPTAAIAIGAAAGMAAQARLLLTSILFGALLVGSQGLDAVPAAVLAASAAWMTVMALDRRTAVTQGG